MGGQASEQASGCGPGRHRQLGRQISSKADHRWPMAESGQPLLPASAWQAITQTTQPQDSQWQVSDRRYLSEGSVALLTTTTKEVTPAQLMPA
jgi:hypothetical protein